MKNIITYIFFVFIFISQYGYIQAQARYVYEFEKLSNVVVVKDYREIEKLKQESTNIFDINLFYTTDYLINNVISSVFFYRKGNDWLVYETPFGGDRMFPYFAGYSDDKQYAFFQVESISHIARGSETNSSYLYIIDLFNGSFTSFETFYYQHHWSYSEDEQNTTFNSFSTIKSQIIIEGNNLTVLESDFSIWEEEIEEDEFDRKFGWYDSQSGIYKIQNQKLVKTHYYDSTLKRMKPIFYAGKLAVGMVLRDITEIYNFSYGIELKEVPQFAYGYDSEKVGLELWVSDKPLYFVIVPDQYSKVRRIEHLIIISPEILVHGLRTGMTVETILKKHPNSKLNIDLISDWEYIYIEKLKIKIVFKTDKTNRIAEYKLNEKKGNFITTKILDKTRKIDLIEILN